VDADSRPAQPVHSARWNAPRPLADGYSVDIDTVSPTEWYGHVVRFGDANIYQVWQPADGPEARDTSTLLVRRHGEVAAAAEVRLFMVPLTRRGIAYVRWGPLWKRSGDPACLESLRQALRALYREYVVRRGLVLRVMPRLTLDEGTYQSTLPGAEGFLPVTHLRPERTLLLSLAPDLDVLRKGLASTWRRHLNKAERAGLTISEATTLESFDAFRVVYDDMVRRKGFVPWAAIDRHRQLQSALPEPLKMHVLLARRDGHLAGGLVYTAIGDTAIFLFGASNDLGMQTGAAFLLHWEAVKGLKERGIREYDLNGINRELNPGIYQFKNGLAGKHGREVTFVGQFQAFRRSPTNSIIMLLDRVWHRWRTRATTAAPPRPGPAAGPENGPPER
jgi:Acetyltransferase (GNAT) domain